MKRLLVFSALACMALSACKTTTGTTSAMQTFTDVYNAALTADDLAVQGGTAALNAGLITSAQAQNVQNITIKAKALLDAAQVAFNAGNAVAANQNVTAATITLVALTLCLTQKPLTVATFTTCASSIPSLVTP